ncbi:MAG: hypothetical protein ACR2H9_08380 [Longimicrobiaceae bacterium]
MSTASTVAADRFELVLLLVARPRGRARQVGFREQSEPPVEGSKVEVEVLAGSARRAAEAAHLRQCRRARGARE